MSMLCNLAFIGLRLEFRKGQWLWAFSKGKSHNVITSILLFHAFLVFAFAFSLLPRMHLRPGRQQRETARFPSLPMPGQ